MLLMQKEDLEPSLDYLSPIAVDPGILQFCYIEEENRSVSCGAGEEEELQNIEDLSLINRSSFPTDDF